MIDMDIKFVGLVFQHVLENARLYVQRHHTADIKPDPLSQDGIPTRTGPLDDAPIVRLLTGVLPQNLTMNDYKKHLDEKYGQ
jgi:hypothetical protein